MGSTGTHRIKGMTDRAFFENELPTTLTKHGRIIACSSKTAGGDWNRVFYAAVQNNADAPHAPGKTWCLVVLMHTSRNPDEYFNFTYKDLDENMGPAQDTCPTKILDLLSDNDNAFAIEWRAKCRAFNAKREAAKIDDGQVVVFERAWDFQNGASISRFRHRKDGRRKYWVALSDDGDYRFTCRLPQNWFERTFTLAS